MKELGKLIFLSVLSGLLMTQLYQPQDFPWAIPFAFVPLWYYWMGATSYWRIFLSGWIAQFTFSACAFYWITTTADLFFGAPGVIAYVYLFAFSAIAHIKYPIGGLCWKWMSRRFSLGLNQGLVLLVLVSTWFEMVWPQIFPQSQGDPWVWSHLDVIQLSDIFGVQAISAVTFALTAIWLGSRSVIRAATINAALVLSLCALGYLNKQKWSDANANLKVHVFQVNIDPIEVIAMAEGKERATEITLGAFFDGTRPDFRLGVPDLVVWSETAMPFDVAHANPNLDELKKYIQQLRIPLITGAYRYSEAHQKHNSAAFFAADGDLKQVYDKYMLMPFGEFLPGEEFFPILRKWAPQIPQYGKGHDPSPFLLGDARLGPSICYEGLFPDHFRMLSNAGANVFVNISSDFWFGKSTEAYMHGFAVLARAIEFRRPLVRVADTGITTAILADGTILEVPPIFEPYQKTLDVGYVKNPPRTVFDLYGQWWPYVLAAIIGLHIYLVRRTQRQG